MVWRNGISRRDLLRYFGAGVGTLMIPGLVSCAPAPASVSTGATGSEAAAGTASGIYTGAFTATMTQNPQGLDPQVNSLTESFQAMLACFEQLVDYDPCTDSFFPQLLAEMPDMSDTSLYVLKLRDGLKFHSGDPLTAEDVKSTFDFVLEQGPASPAYGLYSPIDTITIIDPLTIEFKLKFGYGLFIPYLSSVMGGIVRRGARDSQDLQRDPSGAGSGPFKFVEWVDGSHLTFERFEDYHIPGVPAYQQLTYRILVDESARTAQLLAGTVDFSDDVPKKDFATLIARDDLEGVQGVSEKVSYVMFNFANEMFQNKDLRKAMSYAVDRNAILQNVFDGYGIVATGPMKPGTRWYDPAVEELASLNLEKAREHLVAAGYPDGVTFDVLTQNNQRHIDMSQLLQDMWKQVGINVNVVPLEKTALFDKAVLGSTDWTVVVTDWSSSVYSPDYMLKLVYATDGSYQRAGYSNPKVDQLLADAQRSGDEAEQVALFSEIATEMADDTAAIWMVWEAWTPVWRKEISGYCAAPTYYDYYDNVKIDRS
ncbi:MAG: ABC transporter substrate-binding protein [Caldilineaceae bacterium]|nr:ABC transporter substrate-binding protein [Caldilineaceae bacterium]